jgi:protein TonB
MATLNAQIEDKLRAYAERPRRKFINARTREYKYAAYMEAWRAKVERVGNLNYPDQARRENLSGSLLLDVALRPDGSIESVNLRRSSGYPVLDDAAMRIVRLAAPYAPFPADIREETDILHIERTWQFLGSNRLFAR